MVFFGVVDPKKRKFQGTILWLQFILTTGFSTYKELFWLKSRNGLEDISSSPLSVTGKNNASN